MSRFQNKTDYTRQLQDERKRLITAIRRVVRDAKAPSKIQKDLSTALKHNLLLVVALGESQYFWLCYWTDGQGEARAYDEDDFGELRDCDQDTPNEEVDDIVGPSEGKLLYAERVEEVLSEVVDCSCEKSGVSLG
jgi:hypothetical protein